MDEKDCTQLHLERLSSAPKTGSKWKHYKGGEYEIICCSIKEDTLEPLVTYRSLLKGYLWNRTLDNWESKVADPSGDYLAPKFLTRFSEITTTDRG